MSVAVWEKNQNTAAGLLLFWKSLGSRFAFKEWPLFSHQFKHSVIGHLVFSLDPTKRQKLGQNCDKNDRNPTMQVTFIFVTVQEQFHKCVVDRTKRLCLVRWSRATRVFTQTRVVAMQCPTVSFVCWLTQNFESTCIQNWSQVWTKKNEAKVVSKPDENNNSMSHETFQRETDLSQKRQKLCHSI